MKKRFLTVSFLIFPLLAGSCQDAGNLLINPSFESGSGQTPDHWNSDAYINDSNHFQPSIDSERYSGRRSLKIINSQPDDSWLTQNVSVKGGHIYKLSGWVRTEDVGSTEGKVGANLCIGGSSIRTASLKGTQPWTKVQCYFKTSADRTTLAVNCRVGYTGSTAIGIAWFDDIELKEVSFPANIEVPVY